MIENIIFQPYVQFYSIWHRILSETPPPHHPPTTMDSIWHRMWVYTEIWYFFNIWRSPMTQVFLWRAPWILELLQGFWNEMWKFIRPFMKWLFSMKTPTREGWLLAHFTPKPWEQLQNPGSNFKPWEHSKTYGAIPKPSEQPTLTRWGLHCKSGSLRWNAEWVYSTPNGLFINIPYPVFCILSVLNHVSCILYPLCPEPCILYSVSSVLNHVSCILYPLCPEPCILYSVSSVLNHVSCILYPLS